MDAFRSAVEAGDAEAIVATFAPDVRFNSPAVFRPYLGRDTVAPIMRAVVAVLSPTLRYTWTVADEPRHVLGFDAQVDGKDLQGVDIITVGDDGLIEELTVMIRPLSGLEAVRNAIGARLGSTP